MPVYNSGTDTIMTEVQIILLIIGILMVVVSFIFGELLSTKQSDTPELDKDMVNKVTREIVEKEVNYELANVIDEKVEAAEVELDKISNDKIMALGEYSENVLEEIKKNHTEVMFLYNMLTEKEDTLKDTIRDIEALKTSVKQMAIANDFAKQAAVKKTVKAEPKAEIKPEPKKPAPELTQDDISQMLADIQTPNETPKDEPIKSSSEGNNNNQKILELYNKGMSNMDIAKELGLGIGEVKLVIGLFTNAGK